jgi:hypothetical protein
MLVDFESHDPAGRIQFKGPFSLKHGIPVQTRDGYKDFLVHQGGRVGAVEIFQGLEAAAGVRQAESEIGKIAGFGDGKGNFDGMAAFDVALFVSGIERGLKGDVIVKAVFLRVVDATRDSKGHKGNRIFIILEAIGRIADVWGWSCWLKEERFIQLLSQPKAFFLLDRKANKW